MHGRYKWLLATLPLLTCLNSCAVLGVMNIALPRPVDLLPQRGDVRPLAQPLSIDARPRRLALGNKVAVGVREDGTVWSWGVSSYGELGNGLSGIEQYTPTKISNLEGVVEVATGGRHFLALRKDGTVWSWGVNEMGALGYETGREGFGSVPRQVPGLSNIVQVAAS